jgi:hypothetical protein
VSSGTVLDAELLLWLRAAPRPLGSLSAAFHHAERAPRATSSLTAESPTIQKLQNILGVDIGTLATQVMRARKTRKWSYFSDLGWLAKVLLNKPEY